MEFTLGSGSCSLNLRGLLCRLFDLLIVWLTVDFGLGLNKNINVQHIYTIAYWYQFVKDLRTEKLVLCGNLIGHNVHALVAFLLLMLLLFLFFS